MKCNEFKEKVADLFDKTIDLQTQAQLSEHMKNCPECKAYYEELRETFDMLQPEEVKSEERRLRPRLSFASSLWKTAAILIAVFLCGLSFAAYRAVSPKQDKVAQTDSIYKVVAVNAEYPGGFEKCFNFINEHSRYPRPCKHFGVQGRVIVIFVVEKDGSISNIRKIRGPGIKLTQKQVDEYNAAYPDNQEHLQVGQNIGELLYAEAERVMKEMPRWSPAKDEEGRIVRSHFTIPFIFKLK
ncbi:MAG: zf-HC2 domain-containing protein [Bacteroidaceae bacterium]|nr:zf-HC2 domain-containing protein [Bacteroidaceae bacterium]